MNIRSLLLTALVATAAIPTFAKASADRPEVAEDAKQMSKKTIAVKAAKIAGYTAEVVVPIMYYGLGVLHDGLSVLIAEHKNEDRRVHWLFVDGFAITVVGNGIYGLQKELKPYFKHLINKIKNRKNSKIETA